MPTLLRAAATCFWMLVVVGSLGLCLVRPALAVDDAEQPVLGREVEALVPGLLAPWQIGGEVTPGVRIEGVSIGKTSLQVQLRGPAASASLRLTLRPAAAPAGASASFVAHVAPNPPPPSLAAALTQLWTAVQRNDQGAVRAAAEARVAPQGERFRLVAQPSTPFWTVPPGVLLATAGYQALLLVGVVLVLVRWRWLTTMASRVPMREWLGLLGVLLLALALRLYGGQRVPGYNNNHGFGLLSGLLEPQPNHEWPYHGLGMDVLHRLAFLLFPQTESTVLVVQLTCSCLTVAASWGVARLWWGRPVALWSALLLAVLSGPVYYGYTEVPHVPGTFLLSLSLLVMGLALRGADAALLAAAVAFATCAAQFHPVLLATPVVLGLFVLAHPNGRIALRRPATWLFLAALSAALLPNLLWAVQQVQHSVGRSAAMLPTPLRLLQALAVRDGFDAAGNRFLNPWFTPPTFSLLAVLGMAVGLARPATRPVAAVTALTALVWTAVQLSTAQMDALRHQLVAQGFWALLAGAGLVSGCGWLQRRLAHRQPLMLAALGLRDQTLARTAGVALVVASVSLWPGPLGMLFTPQYERQVYAAGIAQVPDDCTIAHIRSPRAYVTFDDLPDYLSLQSGRQHKKGYFSSAAELRAATDRCLVYYRPAACWHLPALLAGERPPGYAGMLPECQALEEGVAMQPLYVVAVPDLPDAWRKTVSRDRIAIGFFRVPTQP